ncbi:MAG: thiol peroxidase [Spirochaetales bacterium]|nr:thiol peroxidase [Spirochaetales bacterium]
MATVTLEGNELNTTGQLPETGTQAPDFVLTTTDLSDVSLADYKGKKLILNIFPSLDTSVCATSVRRFNEVAGKTPDTEVLCISKDLPFAHKRFCGSEGLNNVISLSEMRSDDFGKKYGIKIAEGPLAGLFTRSVVIVDEKGNVKYTQLVPEITSEPDYDDVLLNL